MTAIHPSVHALIAEGALKHPYRQVEPLDTEEMSEWLNKSGIGLGGSWETLHRLWLAGVICPVSVLEPAIAFHQFSGSPRFELYELGYDKATYIDLGIGEVDVQMLGPHRDLPRELAEAVLWHPFQLPVFASLHRTLTESSLAPTSILDAEGYLEASRHHVEWVHKWVAQFPSQHVAPYLRVLALLLHVEPLVHTQMENELSLYPVLGETIDGYLQWRDQHDGAGLLNLCGLTVQSAVDAYEKMVVSAQMVDPLRAFRTLMAHIDRRKLEETSGAALQAQRLYDLSELLARYLEAFHGVRLPELDELGIMGHDPAAKEEIYGSARTLVRGNRTVARRVAREFGLDPQVKLVWFVEGPTEIGYYGRLGERRNAPLEREGIELMNLDGIGGLDSKRFRELASYFRRQEVFVYVAVDREASSDHLRLLAHYVNQGLLPLGYKVWDRDFEEENFTMSELATVASTLTGSSVDVSSIESALAPKQQGGNRLAIGAAIERLLGSALKGEAWGRALADWTADHPCDGRLPGCEDGHRPSQATFEWVLQAARADYAPSLKYAHPRPDGTVEVLTPEQLRGAGDSGTA